VRVLFVFPDLLSTLPLSILLSASGCTPA
jgi:hypothetical protein